jgi:hypothetical protein
MRLEPFKGYIPQEQIVHRYHNGKVVIYHLKSQLDGYESLVAVPKQVTSV